jgi:hypothetical protein
VIRALYTGDAPNKSEWADRYKEAMDMLGKIASGEVHIDELSFVAGTPTSNTEDYEPTFHEGDPTTWGVDDDRLDDIADERDD